MNKKGFPKFFNNALQGLVYTFKSQRNFRIHLSIALFISLVAIILRINILEWCILILLFIMVLAAELFNTAIEEIGNALSLEPNDYIKKGKDISAAAVLIITVGAVVIGLFVFGTRLIKAILN